MKSELGTSVIKRVNFETVDLSRGILMKLGFSDIISQLTIVKSLEKVLRIAPSRIKVLTSTYELQEIKDKVTTHHNAPEYVYEVVIAPDPTNDTKTPMDIAQSFEESEEEKEAFKELIP